MKPTADIIELIDALPHPDMMLTTAEVAELCGVPLKTACSWCNRDRGRRGIVLRSHRDGNHEAAGVRMLVRAKHLRAFLIDTE